MPSSSCSLPVTSRSSSRAPSISSALDSGEYELDSSIARAEAARRGARNYFYRGMRIKGLDSKALDQLPPELLARPKKRHDKPDLLYHFGFGVSFQQLHDYCVARDLLPNHYHGALTRYAAMVEAAVKEISRLCGAKLYLSTVLHIEYQWVLARYSNHTWHREDLRDRDELNAAGAIQRELGLHEPPKWYRQRVESPCGCFLM